MQFPFLLSILFDFFAVAALLKRRESAEERLERIKEVKNELVKLVHDKENGFCEDGIWLEMRVDEPQAG